MRELPRTRELVKSACFGETPPWVKAGLSFDKWSQLRAIGEDSELGYRVTLQRICSESFRYLESLARDAREGKHVFEAANFCRWLRFSGVTDLLERYAMPGQNFSTLSKAVDDLISDCGEQFRGGKVLPKYSESDIAEINRKLDVLLSQSAAPAATVVTVGDFAPSSRAKALPARFEA